MLLTILSRFYIPRLFLFPPWSALLPWAGWQPSIALNPTAWRSAAISGCALGCLSLF